MSYMLRTRRRGSHEYRKYLYRVEVTWLTVNIRTHSDLTMAERLARQLRVRFNDSLSYAVSFKSTHREHLRVRVLASVISTACSR
jgi:hypothetical protein